MIRISSDQKIGVMDAYNSPAAFCSNGDIVIFDTLDCSDGAVSRNGVRDRTPGKYIANPATGPLYVREAMPGDTLKVEILSLKTADWGFMGSGRQAHLYRGIDIDYAIRIFDISGGTVKLGGREFPVRPMIGVIGVAPSGEGIETMVPDSHGGNMDCTSIREGAVLYLPVNVPGALLAMGDLHAAMGDGEVFWYGLETAGEVTVRVSVIKGRQLRMPAVETGNTFAVIASAKTLDECSELAVEQLYDILVDDGWDPVEAGYLLSLRCDLKVCQIVDPNMTVRAEIDSSLLNRCGELLSL